MIKEYLFELARKNLREDDRKLMQFRDIKIDINPVKRANGSARVRLGNTEVLVGVKLNLGTPFPDTPAEGVLMVGAELSPLADPNFELGPPREDAIELARVVDRAIRESKCIDFSKLCVEPKEKVWMVMVDVYPINNDGNLFDAALIGAMTAIKNTVFPEYDAKEERVLHDKLTKNKLPLTKIPILCTFCKLGDKLIIDPTDREQKAADARLSIATIENGNVCDMQKGGNKPITEEEVLIMVDEATKQGKIMRKFIK